MSGNAVIFYNDLSDDKKHLVDHENPQFRAAAVKMNWGIDKLAFDEDTIVQDAFADEGIDLGKLRAQLYHQSDGFEHEANSVPFDGGRVVEQDAVEMEVTPAVDMSDEIPVVDVDMLAADSAGVPPARNAAQSGYVDSMATTVFQDGTAYMAQQQQAQGSTLQPAPSPSSAYQGQQQEQRTQGNNYQQAQGQMQQGAPQQQQRQNQAQNQQQGFAPPSGPSIEVRARDVYEMKNSYSANNQRVGVFNQLGVSGYADVYVADRNIGPGSDANHRTITFDSNQLYTLNVKMPADMDTSTLYVSKDKGFRQNNKGQAIHEVNLRMSGEQIAQMHVEQDRSYKAQRQQQGGYSQQGTPQQSMQGIPGGYQQQQAPAQGVPGGYQQQQPQPPLSEAPVNAGQAGPARQAGEPELPPLANNNPNMTQLNVPDGGFSAEASYAAQSPSVDRGFSDDDIPL